MTKRLFFLGNCLRGGYSGYFTDPLDAWQVLCARFNAAYPTTSFNGREVLMYVHEKNPYGFDQSLKCRLGNSMEDRVEVSPERFAELGLVSDRDFI